MGNTVFRFFLEWLKSEMHEEAYARLVKKTEKREMAMRGKTVVGNMGNLPGWIQSDAVLENKEIPSVEYSVADQMYTLASSVVESFDEMWQSYITGVQEDKTKETATVQEEKPKEATTVQDEPVQERISGKKHPHLWELAQAEGDDAWLEWINDHIWTYIGLSAPLLGAMNPLRAVLSGENMGLPMTEEKARNMEICKYVSSLLLYLLKRCSSALANLNSPFQLLDQRTP